MRVVLACLTLLAGCDTVFDLHRPGPHPRPDGCYGTYGANGAGFLLVCLDALPTDPLSPMAAIDTDTQCTQIVTQTDLEATQVCVVAATTIDLPSGLHTRGSRPLVLIATETMTIGGLVDASTKSGGSSGPGSNPLVCVDRDPRGASGIAPGGGGGGAGGSFGAKGGPGGVGSIETGSAQGGIPLAAVDPTALRGGCHGGAGGKGIAVGGVRGDGGGAIYLIAGTSISVDGRINASGAGGAGGLHDVTHSGGGGGGGGSGGMIVLDAPRVVLSGSTYLVANGAGGGGGGGDTTDGDRGNEPELGDPDSLFQALGGAGGQDGGGSAGGGGNGGHGTTPDGTEGETASAGAGGGGGGAGVIRIFTIDLANPGAVISPSLP